MTREPRLDLYDLAWRDGGGEGGSRRREYMYNYGSFGWLYSNN